MISDHALLLGLRKERHYWSKQLQTDYILGIMRGFEMAMTIVKTTIHVSPEAQAKYLAKTNGWNATRLYKALRASLHYLKVGNRKRALFRLQKEIETVRKERIAV